jgi:ferredoxin
MCLSADSLAEQHSTQANSEERPMKIVLDYDLCEANALCMEAAPEVFRVEDDDTLTVLIEEPGEELRSKVEEAARLCPRQAITLTES